MIVLDTHALVWMDAGDKQLGRKTRARIEQDWRKGEVLVSAISFWEVAVLAERGRIKLASSIADWRHELIAAGLTEVPLDGHIALRASELNGLSEDPADRFIAATALLSHATLVTADRRSLAWKHTLERLDART
ncbi:MAG: type II toxin-antitoxin system VapC family toxin [Betaproteobacteria bacterium]|nr:type II toxin-antitoxin system VapC family toxin [Betaproteobacteria bacterium]